MFDGTRIAVVHSREEDVLLESVARDREQRAALQSLRRSPADVSVLLGVQTSEHYEIPLR